jgi:hypothetical protein
MLLKCFLRVSRLGRFLNRCFGLKTVVASQPCCLPPAVLPSILFVVLSPPQRPNHVRRTASKGLSRHRFVAESPVIEPTVEEWL